MEQAKIEPPRPLPSIGLSHLPVRQRFELLSPSALISMAKVEPNIGRRVNGIPSTKHSRLPVFALTLNSTGLDQGCDRRVESDFNTDSY